MRARLFRVIGFSIQNRWCWCSSSFAASLVAFQCPLIETHSSAILFSTVSSKVKRMRPEPRGQFNIPNYPQKKINIPNHIFSPFQSLDRFSFSKFIVFAKHLDITYV